MAIQFIGDFMYSYPSYWESVLITASFKGAADKGMAARTMELMQKHYEFYGELMEENSYVTRGSILCCSAGSTRSIFDLPIDHAVERSDGAAVGICTDCKENENIISFGYCSNPTPEGYPKRSATASFAAPGGMIEKEKCIPMLEKRWQTGSGDDLRIYDQTQGIYSEALTSGAFLTCFYGGVIKVDEVPKHYECSREYITLELLNNKGWKEIHCGYQDKETGQISPLDDMTSEIERRYRDITQDDINEINYLFDRFEINTKKRICAFFAQCSAETGNGSGFVERAYTDIGVCTRTNLEIYFNETKYKYKYRGGGSIHLTWDYNYEYFQKWIENNFGVIDKNILELGTEYVATTYPWKSGVFFWDHNNLNVLADAILDIDENDSIYDWLENFDAINKLGNQYNNLFESIDEISREVVGRKAEESKLKPRRKYYVLWTKNFPEF